MSVNYSIATINARLNAVVTQIGAGGFLQVGTAGMGIVLSSIPLANPCGTVAGGVLTFTTPEADPLIANSGTMAAAQIVNSALVVIASGLTVGNSSAFDIVAPTLSIVAGNVLSLTSATITGN